ncbi:hypothetical protein THF5H11_11321 [Vibrio jasicida]|uniref:Uncharacterized protein n=1 Tax=Vibrio jasicida TaxID=766224 RepID=A0AAU9QT81_9VIBR|nr:hypothetical protein THF5H11_11321 [Vibrio jasicida]CAH1601096.1 hypothetical protein THF1A12_460023 [Vibrio jasicida]
MQYYSLNTSSYSAVFMVKLYLTRILYMNLLPVLENCST